jgi:ABC-2 type transport system ATP-binding protein
VPATEREPCGGEFAVMKGVELKLGGKTILDYVDLTVREGELLALVGANGAGKSSVMRCLAGVWQPTSGEIKVEGLDRRDDDLAIRRFTTYLPPEPSLLSLSIRENMRVFAETYRVEEDGFHERMDALLRMFDLKDKQDASAGQLSKGELKKACVACVLVTGARLYIMDEPFTGGIDPRGYDSLRRVLGELAANRHITVVFATQVLELAVQLADRVAVVNGGRVLAVGTVDDLREAAGVQKNAHFSEVFARIASKDTLVPVEDFLANIRTGFAAGPPQGDAAKPEAE